LQYGEGPDDKMKENHEKIPEERHSLPAAGHVRNVR
jgi:hypothetical protein